MRRRMPILDTLRGIALLNMMLYHLFYDIVYLFDAPVSEMILLWSDLWQELIGCTFLFLSGLCAHFSRRPLRRILHISGCAFLITALTAIFVPSQIIVFGILHCLAACSGIYYFFWRFLVKVPAKAAVMMCLALYAALFSGLEHLGSGALPVQQNAGIALCLSILGFPSEDFRSSDYFPLLPYLFMYLTGCYASAGLSKLPSRIAAADFRFFRIMGKYSLSIYLIHQPILLGALSLVYGSSHPITFGVLLFD